MISIIVPCRNEARYIRACLESIQSFEIPKEQEVEILVMDGGSTDGTKEIVFAMSSSDNRIVLVDNPGRIQSCALNLGIRRARGEWILRLDAHAVYPREYLLKCYETARRTGAHNTGGIWITRPGGEGYGARLVQALMTHRFGVGNSGFRTGVAAGPRDTVPFGFFCRRLFEEIGLFDERLVRTQDYELNRRLVAMGGLVFLDPSIYSYYYAPKSLLAVMKKYLLKQGPFVAYMWYLAPYSFSIRHAVPAMLVLGLTGLAVTAAVWRTCLLCLAAVVGAYGVGAVAASVTQAVRYREPLHVLFLPLSFLAGHVSYGLGVLVGLAKLALGVAPVQKTREPWSGAGVFRVSVSRRITMNGCE